MMTGNSIETKFTCTVCDHFVTVARNPERPTALPAGWYVVWGSIEDVSVAPERKFRGITCPACHELAAKNVLDEIGKAWRVILTFESFL